MVKDQVGLNRQDPRDIGGAKEALEQQNWFGPSARSSRLGLCKIQDCQPIGRCKCLDGMRNAMSVGISLCDRPEPTISRRGSANQLEIVGKRVGTQDQGNWARHLRIVEKPAPAPVLRHRALPRPLALTQWHRAADRWAVASNAGWSDRP